VKDVRLPPLGTSVERATIVAWHKRTGEALQVGDVLYEVETEKSSVEVEAPYAGTLARIVTPEGAEVAVGDLLAVMLEPGELLDEPAIDRHVRAVSAASPEPTAEEPKPAQAERPAAIAAEVSPRARRLARERGIDIEVLARSLGRSHISERDVLEFAATTAEPGPAEEIMTPNRVALAMAQNVTRSWQTIPQFTQIVEVDATALVGVRERLSIGESRITYTDLLAWYSVQALRTNPVINARFEEERLHLYPHVNLGMAMNTERGLVVPVIREAESLAFGQLVEALRAMEGRAREGKLSPSDFEGGTFTVSNLGAYGIDFGTPLVQLGQCAILFVGRIRERVIVKEGKPVVAPTLWISIAYDHRIASGVTAAGFTQTVAALLEKADLPAL